MATPRENCYCIGPRASGKTSLGALLAQHMGLPCVDTDALVVERAGKPIAAIVASEGWPVFRQLEHDALASVRERGGCVVACGGGIVLRPDNRALLHGAGPVFYLAAAPDVFAARLMADPLHDQRPSLTGASIIDEVRQVLAERDPLYRACATHVLDAAVPLDTLAALALGLLPPGFPRPLAASPGQP
ncbi:MAG: shikimate kinase AroL [Desulfovibrionaceae bacterium]